MALLPLQEGSNIMRSACDTLRWHVNLIAFSKASGKAMGSGEDSVTGLLRAKD